MQTLPLLFAIGLIYCAAPHRCHAADAVTLWRAQDVKRGLTLDEETTVELKDGKMHALIGANQISGGARANLSDKITRVFKAADEQRVEVHATNRFIAFNLGGQETAPKIAPGQLTGKTLIGKRDRKSGEWVFTLADGKPEPAEDTALKQFAGFSAVVDAFPLLYGAESRRIGVPWKPDLGALTKTIPGLTVTAECVVREIVKVDREDCAKIDIAIRVKGKIGDNNKLEAGINGAITRNLRDLVDLDITLTGTVRYTGLIGKPDAQGNGPEAMIEAPVTLKRVVKIVKR